MIVLDMHCTLTFLAMSSGLDPISLSRCVWEGGGICHSLKHAYDKANFTLEGQRSAMGESCWIETDAFGAPTVTHKFQKEDISVPEKSDEAVEIERVIAPNRFKRLIADEPDVIPELNQESDAEEDLGGNDEDPDVPEEKKITNYRGVERTIEVDRQGTMITAKTPQKTLVYTNEEWRRIEEPVRIVMLADYDRRQRWKCIRGTRGDWTGLSEEQRQGVRLHFEELQEERRSQIEAAMPAPADDWGTGICDLSVKQLEKQLQSSKEEKDHPEAKLALSRQKTQRPEK